MSRTRFEENLADLVSLPQPDLKTEVRVEEFEPDRDYAEIEVNRMLVEFHEDVASLRREMISFKLMSRSHGIYRRI